MDTALWILQGLLAALFLATGLTKLTQPRTKLAAGPMRWAADVSDTQFRTIGLLEIAGAVGIILPAALGIAPALYLANRSGRTFVAPMETVDDPALQGWFERSRGRLGVRIVGLRAARPLSAAPKTERGHE